MPYWLKRVLYRTHWILGLSAGLVLALVGATGAMLGFERDIVDALNPEYRVTVRGEPQSPDALIARVRERWPDRAIAGYTWNGPERVAEVRFDGREAGSAAIDPYDARILEVARGKAAFRSIEQLHRNLASGPVGKQIVGASTVALFVFAITGLILRWPRQWRSPRAWLLVDFRLRGRAFLWNLHAVTATWVLLFYLCAALTGLTWSYEAYRGALNKMAGVAAPQRAPTGGPGGRGEPQPPPLAIALDPSWRALLAGSGSPARATINLPRKIEAPLEWRYLDADAPHERAYSLLRVDPADGHVLAREPFAQMPAGRRAIAAIFPLHAGSYFGTPGRIAMAIASALMPLFAVTGIWMWLKRRRESRATAGGRSRLTPVTQPQPGGTESEA